MDKEKNNKAGWKTVAAIIAIVMLVYYLFIFDYKTQKFTWIDSIIALIGMGVVISAISKSESN